MGLQIPHVMYRYSHKLTTYGRRQLKMEYVGLPFPSYSGFIDQIIRGLYYILLVVCRFDTVQVIRHVGLFKCIAM